MGSSPTCGIMTLRNTNFSTSWHHSGALEKRYNRCLVTHTTVVAEAKNMRLPKTINEVVLKSGDAMGGGTCK